MKIKLTYDQLEALKKNAVSKSPDTWVDSKPKPVKNWTIDDLARGKPFSSDFIKKSIHGANVRRSQHRYAGWKGWTKDGKMRSEVRIPTAMYLQPEFQRRYFPEGADEHEKTKALEQLKRDFPIFVTHD